MQHYRKIVAVVDGYSTGRYLASFLHKKGYAALHIQSSPEIPDFLIKSFNAIDYIDSTIYNGDLLKLLDWLKSYQVQAIMAGTETAIFFVDELSELLGLPGNSSKTSHVRRDKYEMIKCIHEGGLATARQCKSGNISEIVEWGLIEMKRALPLVVKPINSAGTDGVQFCYNESELALSVKNILGKKNKLGYLNEEVLVQSFLEGEEYIVNTVTCASKHNLTDIRRCYKKQVLGAGYVSGSEEFISPHEPIAQELKAYTFKALDLLNITYGPAHFEIMYTKEGPQIIEMGARVQGGINPAANAICLGYQQIDKALDAYLDPSHFNAYYKNDYTLHKFGLWVFLISEMNGKITSIPFIEKVKLLPSFFSIQMNVNPGDDLKKTVDYYTSPGHVHLINENNESLMEDFRKLRQFEAEGFILEKSF